MDHRGSGVCEALGVRATEAGATAGVDRGRGSGNESDRCVRSCTARGRRDESRHPRPTATRWCRRVSLDLIGLPPTPEEAEPSSTIAPRTPTRALVDRLLASPHYGERWARRWLDLARYADTNGYEKDRARSIWPYRDWVINALNADMPFDQFTIEQLAGDMLPNATRDQRVATGFHRNTMLNEEGGIDPLEFRFHAMTDRVATTGTIWLGLTVGCAQCHTHKYDPITHREYYQLMAFLNNADEPDLDLPRPGFRRATPGGTRRRSPRSWPAWQLNGRSRRPMGNPRTRLHRGARRRMKHNSPNGSHASARAR